MIGPTALNMVPGAGKALQNRIMLAERPRSGLGWVGRPIRCALLDRPTFLQKRLGTASRLCSKQGHESIGQPSAAAHNVIHSLPGASNMVQQLLQPTHGQSIQLLGRLLQ